MMKGTVRGLGTYKELEQKGVTLFNSIAQTIDTKMSVDLSLDEESFESKIPTLENAVSQVRYIPYKSQLHLLFNSF